MLPVRPATADDLPAVERLYRESVTGAAWLPPGARAPKDFASVVDGEVIAVVETDRGELAGFVSVHEADSFVHHLYVAPPFQRRGVASSLLRSLCGRLPAPWRLKCVRANTSALAFYAARGWVEVGGGDGDDGPYAVLERGDAP